MAKRVNQLLSYLMEGKLSESDLVNILKKDIYQSEIDAPWKK